MKTHLLLFGALLSSATACESHDFLVRTLLAQARHLCVMATQTSNTTPPGKQSPPPAQPARQPTEKSPPAKPAPPPHLFM
jgi:hypothetical protein